MTINTIQKNNIDIALVQSEEPVITDVQSALDLMATVRYDVDCDRIVLHKSAVTEDFFKLSTRIAGEILQKFSTYRIKLAIIGDYSNYTSKPLHDFIYECNNGKDIFFVSNEDEAIDKLAQ